MENQNNHFLFSFLFFFFICTGGIQMVNGSSHLQYHKKSSGGRSKLFVFGDSYADTGNNDNKAAVSWIEPYGITFPGKPSGRFSDGRVLTDFLASFMNIKSPIPYRWRKVRTKFLRYGINFAFGGTGVFDTLEAGPNMTTQIHLLQEVLNSGVYTKSDLNNSIALVSVAGNDYTAYTFKNGSLEGLPAFTTSLINQLALDLINIHEVGMKKVVVTALEPLGCLPSGTFTSLFQSCNERQNTVANFHNTLLQEAVAKLNNLTNDSPFVILDLYAAFMSAFKNEGAQSGSLFENPLKPCCVGVSNEFSCGSVDANGIKKYTVCENPESTFFWDMVHPSQQGWSAVYSVLQSSLNQLFYGLRIPQIRIGSADF